MKLQTCTIEKKAYNTPSMNIAKKKTFISNHALNTFFSLKREDGLCKVINFAPYQQLVKQAADNHR